MSLGPTNDWRVSSPAWVTVGESLQGGLTLHVDGEEVVTRPSMTTNYHTVVTWHHVCFAELYQKPGSRHELNNNAQNDHCVLGDLDEQAILGDRVIVGGMMSSRSHRLEIASNLWMASFGLYPERVRGMSGDLLIC